MKPSIFILAASLALNLILAGLVGYLLGVRHTIPIADSARPFVPSRQALTSGGQTSTQATAEPLSQNRLTSPRATALASSIHPPQFPHAPVSTPSFPVSPESSPDFHPIASASSAGPTAPVATSNQVDDSIPDGRPINTALPGNALDFRGVRVAIAAAYPTTEAGTPLGVDITPNTPSRNENSMPTEDSSTVTTAGSSQTGTTTSGGIAASGTAPTARGTSSQQTRAASSTSVVDPWQGMSSDEKQEQEDELFRMKWGWAAFDAARSEALKQQSSQ